MDDVTKWQWLATVSGVFGLGWFLGWALDVHPFGAVAVAAYCLFRYVHERRKASKRNE